MRKMRPTRNATAQLANSTEFRRKMGNQDGRTPCLRRCSRVIVEHSVICGQRTIMADLEWCADHTHPHNQFVHNSVLMKEMSEY